MEEGESHGGHGGGRKDTEVFLELADWPSHGFRQCSIVTGPPLMPRRDAPSAVITTFSVSRSKTAQKTSQANRPIPNNLRALRSPPCPPCDSPSAAYIAPETS